MVGEAPAGWRQASRSVPSAVGSSLSRCTLQGAAQASSPQAALRLVQEGHALRTSQ